MKVNACSYRWSEVWFQISCANSYLRVKVAQQVTQKMILSRISYRIVTNRFCVSFAVNILVRVLRDLKSLRTVNACEWQLLQY